MRRRTPWLIDAKGRLPDQQARGLVHPGLHNTESGDPASQYAEQQRTGNHDTRGMSARSKLQERAEALGLPLVEYQNSLTMALRHMQGGRSQFIAFIALAAAESEDARKFIVCLSELRVREQEMINVDLVCQAAGCSAVKLLQAVVGVAFTANVETANLIAAAAFPQTIQASVETARVQGDIGVKDRELLMKHHGFLPQPKGTTINVSAVSSAQAASAARAEPSVPSFLGAADAARSARTDVQRHLITEGERDALDPLASVRAGVAADSIDAVVVGRTESVAGDADAIEIIDGSTR